MIAEYGILVVILVVVGIAGFSLERIGAKIENPRLEAIGAAIKSLASDLPGFVKELAKAAKPQSKP